MKLSDFNYVLPHELIATKPTHPRDAARMLVVGQGELVDSNFFDLPKYLKEGDVLVINDSRVIPARLTGMVNERSFEVLLLKERTPGVWECWVKPGKKAKAGMEFVFSDVLSANLVKRENEIFIFQFNKSGKEFFTEVEKVGTMPVPPYILKERNGGDLANEDCKDYQTVFSNIPGSVAAPTAGLHFTDELLLRLHERGVQIEKVTLHVGLGTFQPVNTEDIEEYKIHSEYYEILPEVAHRLNKAKGEGRRIIAVGTTAVRVLESAAVENGSCELTSCHNKFGLLPQSGETKIYIYPGYEWKFVDGIITNFHLPKSSLMLLVAAFSGKEKILEAYHHAIEKHYRFYSYGDGMVLFKS